MQTLNAVMALVNKFGSIICLTVGYLALWGGTYEKSAAFLAAAIFLHLIANDCAKDAGFDDEPKP